jgi:hypothetical protein
MFYRRGTLRSPLINMIIISSFTPPANQKHFEEESVDMWIFVG